MLLKRSPARARVLKRKRYRCLRGGHGHGSFAMSGGGKLTLRWNKKRVCKAPTRPTR